MSPCIAAYLLKVKNRMAQAYRLSWKPILTFGALDITPPDEIALADLLFSPVQDG